ncbi:MAG TPA: hypothetical protein PLP50_03410 [Thermoanaerobaculia bacterium]|nr:hypothetical protein [Thermoanaerobaculia bacterium]HPA50627.1 hypothetical protein [Thermoanaerobaculia bacterium]HQN08160.1 hypothetical protein [Thermoanaerobaculia bacterium]HQP85642.1 hypothetical protein [Thermoanaerobaculia bacterium]
MKIAESFLSLVRRASTDLDVERIRDGVLELSRRHPGLSTRRKAALMVESTARRAALVGAAASVPPGWAAVAATAPELTTLIVLQSRMIVGLHLLYGADLDPEERALEVVAGLASGAGLSVGRRLTVGVAESLATRLAVRAAGRPLAHLIPVAGIAASAALNYIAVRAVGRAVVARVERRWGPPEIAGRGPVLTAEGRVA